MYNIPDEAKIVYQNHRIGSAHFMAGDIDDLKNISNKANFVCFLLRSLFVLDIISYIKNPWTLVKIFKLSQNVHYSIYIMADIRKNINTPKFVLSMIDEKHLNLYIVNMRAKQC